MGGRGNAQKVEQVQIQTVETVLLTVQDMDHTPLTSGKASKETAKVGREREWESEFRCMQIGECLQP